MFLRNCLLVQLIILLLGLRAVLTFVMNLVLGTWFVDCGRFPIIYVLLYSELDQLYSYLECLLVYCRLVYKTKFCVMLLYVLFFL